MTSCSGLLTATLDRSDAGTPDRRCADPARSAERVEKRSCDEAQLVGGDRGDDVVTRAHPTSCPIGAGDEGPIDSRGDER